MTKKQPSIEAQISALEAQKAREKAEKAQREVENGNITHNWKMGWLAPFVALFWLAVALALIYK